MEPVAIGGLNHQIVRPVHGLRVLQDGLEAVAHVAGKDNLLLNLSLGEPKFHRGGAQQVAHVGKAQLHPFSHQIALAVFAAAQPADGPLGVIQIIVRFHRRVAGPLGLPGAPLRLRHLNMGGIPQHDIAQVAGGIRGIDIAPEAVLVELGQHTGVVDVGMGQKDGLHLGGGDGQRRVLKHVEPLLHTAIDQKILAIDLQYRTAAGHLMGGPDKRQFHDLSPPAFRLARGFMPHLW